MEVPGEGDALADQEVIELVRRHGLVVLAGVADRRAVDQAVLPEQLHRIHNLLEDALAAAEVSRLLEALDGHRQHDVLAASHIIAELLIHQRAVGEQHERAVGMLLRQLDDILLSHHRLSAGHDVGMNPEFLALGHDLVHVLIGKVQLMAVLGRPAAGAAEVAGRGRIEQDDPRALHVVLLRRLSGLAEAAEAALEADGHKEALHELHIHMIQQIVEVLGPLAVLAERFAEPVVRFGLPAVAEDLLHRVHDAHIPLASVFNRLLADRVQSQLKRLALGGMCYLVHVHTP